MILRTSLVLLCLLAACGGDEPEDSSPSMSDSDGTDDSDDSSTGDGDGTPDDGDGDAAEDDDHTAPSDDGDGAPSDSDGSDGDAGDADGDAGTCACSGPTPYCLDGVCVACQPGATSSCYEGPPETNGVGPCSSGTRTCLSDGSGYGACDGQVLPSVDICNDIDDDCDGNIDANIDEDGDGYGTCDNDCCDGASDGCSDPLSVNPGAFDFVGDGVDEDCNGTPDDGAVACDSGLASNSTDPTDYARSLELCRATVESPVSPQVRTWGVIQATITEADGSAAVSTVSRSIRSQFGDLIMPQSGGALAVLSTGYAAAAGQTNPSYSDFQTGAVVGTTSAFPTDWSASAANAPFCPELAGANAYDPVMLSLRLRVPTNARSFSLSAYFLSADFPEYVCSAYNDVFVALLDSTATGNPLDKNLAVYFPGSGDPVPLGVNLAGGNTGLFQSCRNGPIGCSSSSATISTCVSSADLAGTGFDVIDTGCEPNDPTGGGTGWLHIAGNVTPGEIINLRLGLWDTGDGTYDSLVLLDAFTWNPDPTTAGTTP